MKAFLAIKYHADGCNRDRIESILLALEQSGFAACCAARDIESWGERLHDTNELMALTFAAIEASDFVVVDLTEKGVGIGIEAGYAYSRHIPIITLAPIGTEISPTLKAISQQVLIYKDPSELNHTFSNLEGLLNGQRL